MTASALAILFMPTEPDSDPDPDPVPLPEPRCSQCGELLARDRRTWDVAGRAFCVDCAFDDIPHTD